MGECMRSYTRVCVGLLLAMVATAAFAEEFRYVLSKKAEVLAEPKFGAPVVTTTAQGSQLVFIEQRGGWVQVRAGKARGWVSRLLVGPTPPLERVTALERIDESATSNVRRRASEVTAAGATRGLTAENRRRANQEDAADFSTLSRIEQWPIDEQEVTTFADTIRGMP